MFFYFSVISWVLRNLTYYRSIFVACVYVPHTHLFFPTTELSKSHNEKFPGDKYLKAYLPTLTL